MKTIIVFVTVQPDCERLIRAGRALANSDGDQIHVVSVRPRSSIEPVDAAALEHLYQVCAACDASMTILYHDSPVKAATHYLKRLDVSHIITGVPENCSDSNFAYSIRKAFSDVPMSVITPSGVWRAILPGQQHDKRGSSLLAHSI